MPTTAQTGRLEPLPGSVPAFVSLLEDVGPADPAGALHLVVVLRLRDEPALRALVDAPGTVLIDPARLLAEQSPSPAVVRDVTAWLATEGLLVASISEDRTLLEVRTTAGAASRALRVPIREYAADEVRLRSVSADPLVPAALRPHLQAIVGLHDAPLRALHVAALSSDASPQSGGAPPYDPTDLRRAYDVEAPIASGFDGSGRVAAITGWGAPSQASFDTYASTHGLPPATLTLRDASGGSSCGTTDQLEWDMDVQLEHAMAPGAALYAYCGSAATLSAMLSLTDRVVSDNVADVISQSWGVCDAYMSPSTASAYESKYLQGASLGQAFFTASGDGGSRECTRASPPGNAVSPSFPATAPHVTSVAGTRLTMSAGTYGAEQTWNTCTPCSGGVYSASGGGPSLLFAKPAWQTKPAGVDARASGDVSAVADPATGVLVRSGGAWWQVGGTSASSPLVAGMWTDLVQKRGRSGSANELLWSLDASSQRSTALRDVTTGHNGDFSAGIGYDYPTGLGSPRLDGLMLLLVPPISAPATLVATGGNGTISLSWSASPGQVDGYRVLRGAPGAARSVIASVAGTSFVDAPLPPASTYSYHVEAYNATSDGLPSPDAVATTWGPPRSAPLGLATGAVGPDRIPLSWSAPADDGGGPVTGYRVYASSTPPGGPTANPAHAARLAGGERFVLQMDEDDHHVPVWRTRDASGLGQHGGLVGVEPVNGRFGAAYAFSGAGDYVDLGGSKGAIAEGAFLAWLRVDDPALSRAFFMQRPGITNDLSLYVSDAIWFNTQQSSTPVQTVPGSVPPGTWIHVAVTWGAAGKRVYVDGELQASNLDTTGVGSQYTRVLLGNSPNDVATGGFGGAIDEARLYARQLGAAEIASLMALPYARVATASDLVATVGPEATFVHRGLAPESTLHYEVSALNSFGEGPRSTSRAASTLPSDPLAPHPVVATRGPAQGEVSLAWDVPASPAFGEVLGYRIYRGAAPDEQTLLAETAGTTFVDAGLPDAATRYYRVRAVNASGEGPASVEAVATTFSPPFAPGDALASVGPGAGAVTLAWGDAPDNGGFALTGWRVYAGASSDLLTLVAQLPPTARSHVDGGHGPATTRWLAVAGVNALGEGARTAAVFATTFASPSAVPALVPTAGPGAGEITLTWGAPASDGGLPVTSYRVYAGAPGAMKALVAEVPAFIATESGLGPDVQRAYAVRAVSEAGEGASSTEAVATTFAFPGAPQAIGFAGTSPGQIVAQWSPPSTGRTPILEYRVYAGQTQDALTLAGSTTKLNLTIDGIEPGGARWLRVTAVNMVGEGPAKAPFRVSALLPPDPPRALKTAPGPGANETTLTWTPPASWATQGVTGYRVHRGASATGIEYLDAVTGAGTLRYVDSTCAMGLVCHYAVTTVGAGGESARSLPATSPGTSRGIATMGDPTSDPAMGPRLVGHEVLVLQMDADDHDQPARGLTRDSSLLSNHGILTRVTNAPGRHGQGYAYSANNQYITLAVDAATSNLTRGTLMLWANLTSLTSTTGVLVDKTAPGFAAQLHAAVAPNGVVGFRTSSTALLSTAPGAFETGRWTHLAFTWSESGKRIYVDGELVASSPDKSPVGFTSLFTDIGVDSKNHAGTGLRGALDEVRVYDAPLQPGLIQGIAARPYAKSALPAP